MLWFDTIIFLLTFYKAIKVRREMPGGLLVTIFRDGVYTRLFSARLTHWLNASGTIYYAYVGSAITVSP